MGFSDDKVHRLAGKAGSGTRLTGSSLLEVLGLWSHGPEKI